MIHSVSKIEAAIDQLEWAIRLFLDHQAYIPAITLAGAAEEILGEATSQKSAHNILKDRLSEKLGMPKKQFSDEHLNLAKNWLKHWKSQQDNEVIELKLESEAIQYIYRAITNLANYDQSQTSESPRFFAWVEEHKRDAKNGL
jgi:hypothetical protein